jgi:membrane-associated phospholipid phosphatase
MNSARYLGGAVVASVVFVALYLFFVRTQQGQAIDQLAYDGADFGRRSVTPFTRGVLDALPLASVVVGLLLTIVVALVRRNGRTLVVAMGVAVAAIATTQLLKYGVLSRPGLGVEGYAGNSFPSGHTAVAAASALAIFLVSSPRTRSWVGVWGTAFAVLAGVSTLADGWHRPSDVIAALLVVAFWGCLGGAILAFGRSRQSGLPRTTGVSRQWWFALPFVVVSAAAFLVTSLHASGDASGALIAYIGGVTAIIAAGFVIALAASRLFARLP